MKKAHPKTGPVSLNSYLHDTAAAQCQRFLAALKRGPVDTITARTQLNILHPPGRIKELRQQGHLIDTRLIRRLDDQGRPHSRIALYSLRIEGKPSRSRINAAPKKGATCSRRSKPRSVHRRRG